MLLFNIILAVPDYTIRKQEEIRDRKIGKEEVKLSLLTDFMIIHLENPKESTLKLCK